MNIETIEGISPNYVTRLRENGINTVESLLLAGATASERWRLVLDTGLSETLILDWVKQADLMRISGVGGEYSFLLRKSGIETVKELSQRNPEDLHKALLASNKKMPIVQRLPSKDQVQNWVKQAAELPVLIID